MRDYQFFAIIGVAIGFAMLLWASLPAVVFQ